MLTREEYEAKRQARYERLLKAADKAAAESASRTQTAQQMSMFIPLGQPILVGHHSERKDRNYRERIHNNYRKGFELAKKAEELRSRAASIANNDAIFSDDPDATEKLAEKIERLEKRQELMKAANKLVRKNDRAGLAALGFSETRITRLFTPDFCGRIGFADFEITNNGANIRRCKERLAQVERKQSMQDQDIEKDGIRIEGRPSENRLRIYYPGRVDIETYKQLKAHGFRVLRSEGEGAFSAYYNNNAVYFVKTYILSK